MSVSALLLALLAGVLGWVRLAPSDAARWHVAPQVDGNETLPNGVKRRIATGPDGLARLDAVARATPRTQLLAGSAREGMATYVTRSRWIGFPDYATAMQDGDDLVIHSRQRFGRRDLGVNRTRVDGWLRAIGAR